MMATLVWPFKIPSAVSALRFHETIERNQVSGYSIIIIATKHECSWKLWPLQLSRLMTWRTRRFFFSIFDNNWSYFYFIVREVPRFYIELLWCTFGCYELFIWHLSAAWKITRNYLQFNKWEIYDKRYFMWHNLYIYESSHKSLL